jgi:hypothetical protein
MRVGEIPPKLRGARRQPRKRMGFLRRLKNDDGIALLMSIGVLLVLTIAGTTVIAYTSSNTRSGTLSKTNTASFSLAEAAFANAMSILNNPVNDPLAQSTLPMTEATATSMTYENGTAKWYGVLDRNNAIWNITALGLHNNPTGTGGAPVKRKLTAKVTVVQINSQQEENDAWNWIYARRTGNACDMTLNNAINGSSRLYVAGNLCLHNAAAISNGPLIVRGNLDLTHKDAFVGAATSMSTRVETYVGGNCRRLSGSWSTPCTGDQDALRIFSKRNPSNFIVGVSNSPTFIPEPVANFALWYEHGIPGPSQPCTTSSGTPPVFDTNYPTRDSSAPTFQLTPGSSYSCRVGPVANPSGELTWDAATKTLKVAGTIYIDGNVTATNGQVNSYEGRASLYMSGTFVVDSGTKLCASISGTSCNFSTWDPNTEMLTIAANGTDASSNGIVVNANSAFQGALFATQNIYLNNNVALDGPIIGNTVIINNAVTTDSFPTIVNVPVGMPGDETIYAQPNRPELFSS